MATIRVPEEAKSLLPLCRKHECGPTEQQGPPCFETYADLIVFAASFGFAEMNGRVPNRKSKFLDRPNPIDFGIFKTDRRFPQILLIALATSRDQNVIKDEEKLCCIVEDFSAVGCSRLSSYLSATNLSSSHLTIAEALIETEEFT